MRTVHLSASGFLAIALIFCNLGTAASATAQDRYAPLVEGILTAWNVADVVCLGEDHGRKHDSDLRIALIRHPKFPALVNVIVVEFANPAHQTLLDRFMLEGVAISRDELAVVWRDASGAEVWESPIYEAFLRAVQQVNLGLPRAKRVRVIGGDSLIDWQNIQTPQQLAPLMNRGGNIRNIIAEQVLDKKLKALAIYGAGHCVNVGMGFPGELADRYPGRLWPVYGFQGEDASRKIQELFKLGEQPAYVVVKGTQWASIPAPRIFLPRRNETIGQMLDAVVFYGIVPDIVVKADTADLKSKLGGELDRRRKLRDEALQLLRRP